jgi:hypothetical protein
MLSYHSRSVDVDELSVFSLSRVVSVDKKSVNGLSPRPLGLTQSRVRQIQAIRELAPTKKGRAISSPGVNVIKLFIFVADTGEK